jgi:hypothetical protein
MYTWHRVFAGLAHSPAPAEVCEELLRHGFKFRPKFRGDEDDWFAACIELDDGASSIQIDRYLVSVDKLRPDLNSWSAWAETLPPSLGREAVLDALTSTVQLFTLYEETPEGEAASTVCEMLCRWLAQQVGAVYQVDGQGFYDSSGVLLVAETADRAHA